MFARFTRRAINMGAIRTTPPKLVIMSRRSMHTSQQSETAAKASPRRSFPTTESYFDNEVTELHDTGIEARRLLSNRRVPFKGKIFVIGAGAVSQCLLPLIPKFLDVPLTNVTVIDKDNVGHKIPKDLVKAGLKFRQEKIDQANILDTLKKNLRPGDFLIDLAWEISTLDLLQWCRENNVLYTNASVELWNPYLDAKTIDIRKFTLYDRHMALRERLRKWGDNSGPTAVLDHGANPGLVSHLVKMAMEHMTRKIIKEKPNENPGRTKVLQEAMQQGNWGALAMNLGIKVIHISERDTQISNTPKRVNEFVNTWSPEGFYEEGVAPAELGWGTHERTLPPHAVEHEVGPRNQICLRSRGINTFIRSWVPTPNDDGNIIGMLVRHGEAFTMSDHLTVRDRAGKALYRPTVHYTYCPSDAAIISLHELRMRHYKIQPTCRVINNEITEGHDVLGCLLMGHDFKSWWIGSVLDIHETRELVPGQNATTLQVAVSMMSAIQWMVENPKKGVLVPDDLPHKPIIREAIPYLGPLLSRPVDWSPAPATILEAHCDYFRKTSPTPEETWQFGSFLVNQWL